MTDKKQVEEKVEVPEEVMEVPKGYYLAKVPSNFEVVMMKDKAQISFEELIIKMANAMDKAGLMKE